MAAVIGYDQPVQKRLNKEIKERLKRAHDRLIRGMEYRQRVREPAWRESMAQYEGNTAWARANPDDPTADVVSVNLSFSTVNTIIPFVADENPEFKVLPYSGDSTQEHAATLELFMNRLWQSSDVHGTRSVRDAAFDWLIQGDGYAEIQWQIDDKPIYTEMGDEVENRVDIASFEVERVNPWDVWIDPYSDGIHNARWVCKRVFVPRSELENDDRFTIHNDFRGEGIDTRNIGPGDEQRLREQDTPEWVTLYEFYDLVERWMLTFVTGGEQVVRYIKHISCPIVQLSNYRIPNSPYHMGELEQIAPLQDELNKTRSQMITHRRRNAAKWMIREHALTEDAEQAIKSGKVNDIIPIVGNDPFNNILAPVHATPLSQDMYMIDEQIREDINEVTGVNEYLRGAPQPTVRTATEASIIEGATNIRTNHKLLQIETFSQDLGQMLLDIMTDVVPLTEFEEMTLYVTGREAERLNRAVGMEDVHQDSTLTPMPEIFEGRYEVRVERGTAELRSPQVEADKYRHITATMLSATPLLMQIGVTFNIRRLLVDWFEAEGLDDPEAYFEPEEEQALMQQLQMLQQANEAMGAGQPGRDANGAPSQVVGSDGVGLGQPNPNAMGPPDMAPGPENSGMLGAAAY